jgi:hypothetical protein
MLDVVKIYRPRLIRQSPKGRRRTTPRLAGDTENQDTIRKKINKITVDVQNSENTAKGGCIKHKKGR